MNLHYVHDAPEHLTRPGPLLRRWVLTTPLGTLRLHHLCAPDTEHYHDHPWAFLSIVLRGGYVESFPDGSTLQRRPGSWAWRSERVLHRVGGVSKGGAWTVVVTGPKRKSWGFQTGATWRPWREVVSEEQRRRVDEGVGR